ncbi:MAG: aminotransferase DegT [Euryarchaeota archaeon]|nr:aminotransferase DegT [Euryarchaeota archaeon]
MEHKLNDLIEKIYTTISKTIKRTSAYLHEPEINQNDIKMVQKILKSGYVSSIGSSIAEFENKLCEYTGTKYAVAMTNGTSSLHVALLASGIQVHDEVLVPAMTFVASANAISYCNAVPHFIDSDLNSLGIDNEKLLIYLERNTIIKNNECFNKNTGRRIFGVIPVHIYGFVGDIETLKKIADQFKITIIEDAAEALGSFKDHRHSGTFGICGCISFNGNKIITTGGGGALITNNEKLAKRARHLSTTAKKPHKFNYFHDEIGFNYRMPAINAALGLSQIQKIDKLLKAKKTLRENYRVNFKEIRGVSFFEGPSDCDANFWLNSIILNEEFVEYQDIIIEKLINMGFECRPIWKLMNKLSPYQNNPSMNLNNAQNLEKSFISIPSSSFLCKNNGNFKFK